MLRDEARVGEVDLGRPAVGVGYGDAVFDDEQVEPARFEQARGILVDLRLLPVVADAVGGVAPALDAESGAEEPAEMQKGHGVKLLAVTRWMG